MYSPNFYRCYIYTGVVKMRFVLYNKFKKFEYIYKFVSHIYCQLVLV